VDDGEWQSLERSRLNAFFTSPDVIAAIWEGLFALGVGSLQAPRILEPAAGVGRFLGLQLADSAAKSVRTAIELDCLTARLRKSYVNCVDKATGKRRKLPVGKPNSTLMSEWPKTLDLLDRSVGRDATFTVTSYIGEQRTGLG
jgi:hypothetical protein